MEEILNFFINYEVWIYLMIGFIGLFYLRKLVMALQEWRTAIFGLEKEYAQRKFSAAMSIILLLMFFAFAEFFFVTFISPGYPNLVGLVTPTMDLLTTPAPSSVLETENQPDASENILADIFVSSEGCIEDTIEWVFPAEGDEIVGIVELQATVNVDNLGFFKYEFSANNGERWVTIAANAERKVEAVLGIWDTTQLFPGDYLLRLVVTDNQGDTLPECSIPVRITAP